MNRFINIACFIFESMIAMYIITMVAIYIASKVWG